MILNPNLPPADDRLESATRLLCEQAIPSEPSPKMLAEVHQIPAQTRRSFSRRGSVKIAVAAALMIVLIGIAALLLQHSTGIAFAQVAQAINNTQTFTADLEASPDDIHVFVKGSTVRVETKYSTYIVTSDKKELELFPKVHQARLNNNRNKRFDPFNFYSVIRDYHPGNEKPMGEKIIKGIKAQGFQLTRPAFDEEAAQTWTLWIDPATKLPVQVDTIAGNENIPLLTNLHFGVPLDDSLFSMSLPADYSFVKESPERTAWNRFHYSGQVMDEKGKPVKDVDVTAYCYFGMGDHGSSYIDSAETDAEGRFNIDADVAQSGMHSMDVGDHPVRLEFDHPDYLFASIGDLHLLPPEQRLDLQVALHDGRTITGTVLDPEGHPVSDALVESVFGDNFKYRKQTSTDAAGKFELHGLLSAVAEVHVVKKNSVPPILSASAKVDLQPETVIDQPLHITLQPVKLPEGAIVHELFGMKLVDLTPELQKQLFVYHSAGVVVLDPGPHSERLIGDLMPGDYFWLVGDHKDGELKDFHDFAQRLLAACREQKARGRSTFVVRVVNSHSGGGGSNTQSIKLNSADMAELEKVLQP